MGAWGHGSFDNDDALDWVGELSQAEDTKHIAETFETVLESDDYLEAPDASTGLAAAKVVAALLGHPAPGLPEEVTTWLAGKKPPSTGLVKKARLVVERILNDSELKDLWAESEDSSGWQREVEELLKRLNKAPA
jgi:hypothetical protein